MATGVADMFYFILGLCAVTLTAAATGYLLLKMRQVDSAIERAISRKLADSPPMKELRQLREENRVMRNLLMDMVENEASIAGMNMETPDAERARLMAIRGQRRREIFGETLFVLQNPQTKTIKAPHLT
jgi:hypothetical protein